MNWGLIVIRALETKNLEGIASEVKRKNLSKGPSGSLLTRLSIGLGYAP